MSTPDEVPLNVTEQRLRDAFAAAAESVAPHSIRDLASPRECARDPGLARLRKCLRPHAWDRQLRPAGPAHRDNTADGGA